MKNRTIAIIGIASYILTVLASAENLEGVSTAPIILITFSALLTLAFFVLAIVRLWRPAKNIAITFIISSVFLFLTSLTYQLILPTYGSPIIILFNLAKIFNLVMTIWVIIKLFKIKNTSNETISGSDKLSTNSAKCQHEKLHDVMIGYDNKKDSLFYKMHVCLDCRKYLDKRGELNNFQDEVSKKLGYDWKWSDKYMPLNEFDTLQPGKIRIVCQK